MKAKIYLEQSLSLSDYAIREAIQGSLDALDLCNVIVATQNAVSTGNNDIDRIKTRVHFEMLRRCPNETPLMFQDRFKNALDAMEQLGDDTVITDVTLSQVY